jgi:hypothetical protein
MVFDDYEWDEYTDNPACHPKQASRLAGGSLSVVG